MSALKLKNQTIAAIRSAAELSGQTPIMWRIFEINHADYELQFKFDGEPVADLWLPVCTRNGKSKIYKSLKAVVNDVKKIDRNAMINYVAD